MLVQPVLIYAAGPREAPDWLRRRAIYREVPVALYTNELFATGHDADNRAAVRAVPTKQLQLSASPSVLRTARPTLSCAGMLKRHPSHRIAAVPFTLRNLKGDLEDVGSNFDGAPDLEFRLETKALELEQSGLSYQRIPPDYRFPYGHTHKEQEEVYVVVRGSGRMKLDDESSRSRSGTSCASRPARGEATRPGRRASRSSSSARPISARIRAETGGSARLVG